MESVISVAERVRSANLGCRRRLSAAELEAVLGVPVQELVDSSASSAGYGVVDSFPPADDAGQWAWSAVRAWGLRRSDPLPAPTGAGGPAWPDLSGWLLRNIEHQRRKAPAELEREMGLTLGQRDFLERVLIAEAAGLLVPRLWVEEILALDGSDEVTKLLEMIATSSRFPASF
ncbi:hypothetical protein WKI65_44000 [Streptomyces sp. MS1.AVA.3]|uniref:hypothetical protein n=1 Tax=Streptomyces decoyicus TaxID=249567 RepID=UPI0030C54EEA